MSPRGRHHLVVDVTSWSKSPRGRHHLVVDVADHLVVDVAGYDSLLAGHYTQRHSAVVIAALTTYD